MKVLLYAAFRRDRLELRLDVATGSRFLAVIAAGFHPFPYRTRQLSPPAPMVVGPQGPSRVGRRQNNMRKARLIDLRSAGFLFARFVCGARPERAHFPGAVALRTGTLFRAPLSRSPFSDEGAPQKRSGLDSWWDQARALSAPRLTVARTPVAAPAAAIGSSEDLVREEQGLLGGLAADCGSREHRRRKPSKCGSREGPCRMRSRPVQLQSLDGPARIRRHRADDRRRQQGRIARRAGSKGGLREDLPTAARRNVCGHVLSRAARRFAIRAAVIRETAGRLRIAAAICLPLPYDTKSQRVAARLHMLLKK